MIKRKTIRKRQNRRRKTFVIIICLICILTVAYGAFSTTLNVNVTGKIRIDSECVEGNVWEFTQKDEGQEFRVPCSGDYKVELWGAQGGEYTPNSTIAGGKGAYVSGKTNLKMNKK